MMTKGWRDEGRRHSLSAKGIRTGRKGTMKASGMFEEFSEKSVYHDDDFIMKVQELFLKEFKHKVSKSDAKWYLKQLWKQYKEDLKEEFDGEKEDARENYRYAMADLKDEYKMMGEPFVKQPFAEWYMDEYGYEPKLKYYIEDKQNEAYEGFSYYVGDDSTLPDYFSVFEEDGEVYIEREDY